MASLEQPAIEAEGLSKKFGEDDAVRDVSFAIPRGTIFGFIGPSGSGKTTTIRLLMGTERPTGGRARVLGRSSSAIGRRGRARLGYMPQQFVLYPDLSVWQNLSFVSALYGLSWRRGRQMRRVLEFVDLYEHRHKRARDISGGMQRRLTLAATLVHNPDVLFLDEPTAGVDPVLRERFWGHFRELQEEGATLFVTTQYVSEAAYCDLVGVMVEGRLVAVDTPRGLRQRAFGGDPVVMRLAEPFSPEEWGALSSLPFVHHAGRISSSEASLVVEHGPSVVPALMEWAAQRGHGVQAIEEREPPFDEVFLHIVRDSAAAAEAGNG